MDVLAVVAAAYGLGEIRRVRYLAEGLMNRNWRVETGWGVFALKQIVDVPVPKARRSLVVLRSLAADGLPVCAPCLSSSADVVVEIGGRNYCLLPWVEGTHRSGTELELEEASSLGALLGEIHLALASSGTGLAPVVEAPRAKVTAVRRGRGRPFPGDHRAPGGARIVRCGGPRRGGRAHRASPVRHEGRPP